jgi:hypothetical protein
MMRMGHSDTAASIAARRCCPFCLDLENQGHRQCIRPHPHKLAVAPVFAPYHVIYHRNKVLGCLLIRDL